MAKKRGFMGPLSQAAGDVNPVWGAAVSGAAGTGTAMVIRAASGLDKHAELIGLGTGMATGLAMMASPRTRAAGFVGVVTALLTQGPRAFEALMSAKQQIKDLAGAAATFTATKAPAKVDMKTQLETAKSAAKAAGFGAVTADRRQLAAASIDRRQLAGGLGAVTADRRQALGIVSPEAIRSLSGEQPVLQGNSQPPVNIVGSQGIAGSFGATIFG